MIWRIIKVSVKVISLSLRLRLITLTSTLIILDITKTESNNCLWLQYKILMTSNFALKLIGNIAWWKGSYSGSVYDLYFWQRRPLAEALAEALADIEKLVFDYRNLSGLGNTTGEVLFTTRLQMHRNECSQCSHRDLDYCFPVVCGGRMKDSSKLISKLNTHCFLPSSMAFLVSPPCCCLYPRWVTVYCWDEFVIVYYPRRLFWPKPEKAP